MNNPRPAGNKRQILRSIGHKLLLNWPYKLIAVLLSLFIWAGLIAQDPTITRDKVFSDVTATISGTETMKRNGFIVTSDLSAQLSGLSLRVSVPQMQYQNVTASNYSPRIDLSRVSSAGTQEIRVLTTSTNAYGTVLDVSPSTITIEVDEYITRNRIPIVRETVGSMPEGWYSTSSTLDPSILTISGPRSVVDRVVRAEAVQDLSAVPTAEGVQRSALAFHLVDANGEEVDSDLLEITSNSVLIDSVIIEQTVYPSKIITFSDTGVVVGKPASGYEIKSVTINPEKVRAAGRSETLDNLDTLFTDVTIDVTDAKDSVTQVVRLRKPSEITYLSQDTVTVAIEVGEIVTERIFSDVRINVVGTESGHTATLTDRYADRVTIEGTQNWLSTLKAGQIALSVDATGLMVGDYEVPVICVISGDDGQEYTVRITPATVQLAVRSQ